MRLSDRDRYVRNVAVGYIISALLWFGISGRIAVMFARSSDAIGADTAMDVSFVLITTGLLAVALRRVPVSLPSPAPRKFRPIRLLWYPLAILAVLAVLWLRQSLDAPLGSQPALILFTIPIAMVAFLGGIGPGLLATALTAGVTNYYLLTPTHSFKIGSALFLVQWLVLILLGLLFSVTFEALRRSRSRAATIGALQSAIVASSDDAIISQRLDGTLTSWNSAAESLFGFSAAEMIGRSISVLALPGQEDDMERILARTAAGETIRQYRTKRRRKDGSIVDISLTVSPLYDIEGRIVGASKIAHDITETLRAEAAQQKLMAQTRTFIDQAPMMIAMFDRAMNCLAASSLWRTEFGIHYGQFADFDEYERSSTVSDEWKAINRRAMAGETIKTDENKRVMADGTVRWLHSVAQPWTDANGEIGGIIIADDDYTDRKQTEYALRESEQRFAAIFRDSPIGVAIADMSDAGKHVEVNDAWLNTLGYERDEVIGHAPDDLGLLAGPSTRESMVGTTSAPGEIWSGEIQYRRKDGAIIDVSLTARQIKIGGRPFWIGFSIDITDRKRMERELRRGEEHLARVQSIARIGSTEVDLDTGNVIWSDEIYRLLGIDRAAIEPGVDSFASAIHPDDRAALRDASLKGRLGQEVAPVEFRVTGSDGKTRWFYRTAAFMRDANGRQTSLIATMYDITERKSAEEALRRNQEHLARVQNVARIGSIEVDLSNQEAIWSDEMFSLLGIGSNTNAPGVDTFASAIHPDDRTIVRELSAMGRRGGDCPPREFRVVHPDGMIRWLYHHSAILRDGDRPVRHIATMYDITERKAAEAARQASEEQYRLTFDMAPLGIAHVALDGRYLLVNDRMCQMFGASRQEMLATNYQSFTHPDFRFESDEQMRLLIAGEQTIASWDKQYLRRDGGVVWCHITSTLMRDEANNPVHFVSTYEDISYRREAEARRLQLEKQLQQSQKMEAIGQLTGGVAHDFNNILTVILGSLDLIQEEIANDNPVRRWIAAASGAARSASDLTRQLLAFSRRQALEPESIDINRRVAKFAPLIERTIGEAIEVRLKLTDTVWPAMIDPGQFDSAILNLAVNARDAMPLGGWIEITTENLTVDDAYAAQTADLKAGDYVRVTVSDSGHGMPPEILAKAFEPFFTTKDVGKGTGLGLSMVFGFIKQSGGNVTIYSEVGKGTVVRLLLPRSSSPATRPAAPIIVAPSTAQGGESIMIVEDDARVRGVTVAFLQALGYRTLDFGTGRDALAVLPEHPEVALLLTDVILASGETGAGIASLALLLRPDIKILFASGYTEDSLVETGHIEASVTLLRKPFTKSTLSAKVREALDRPSDRAG